MKRNVGAILWVLAVWTMVGTLVAIAGWPALVGPVAGLLVGGLVWSDPGGRIWRASADAAIRRRRVGDLVRVTDQPGAATTRRETEPVEG